MSSFEIEAMRAGLNSAEKLIKDVDDARRLLEALFPEPAGGTLFDLSYRAVENVTRLAAHLNSAIHVIDSRDEAGDGDLVVECARRALDEAGL